jgi:hypothetical protein
VARCKVYEVLGSDASRTAGATRCHRDATATKLKVDDRKYPVCKKHRSESWHLFVKDGWLYAIELDRRKPKS